MGWWQAVLNAIQLKPRHLFGVFLIGLVLALFPRSWADALGVWTIIGPIRGWLALAAVVAFCFWVVQLVPVARNGEDRNQSP